MAAEFSFEIQEDCATLSTSKSGWSTMLRKVAWGANPAKFDIRTWSPDDSKCGKGITLTEDEIYALRDYLMTLPDRDDKEGE